MPEGMKRKDIVCILCPKGCNLVVTGVPKEDGTNIEGTTCRDGRRHAVQESTDPRRLVCTSVEVSGGTMPLASVRTAQAIPKDKVLNCLDALRGITLEAPVAIGTVVVSDILQTGIDVITTREVPAGD